MSNAMNSFLGVIFLASECDHIPRHSDVGNGKTCAEPVGDHESSYNVIHMSLHGTALIDSVHVWANTADGGTSHDVIGDVGIGMILVGKLGP